MSLRVGLFAVRHLLKVTKGLPPKQRAAVARGVRDELRELRKKQGPG